MHDAQASQASKRVKVRYKREREREADLPESREPAARGIVCRLWDFFFSERGGFLGGFFFFSWGDVFFLFRKDRIGEAAAARGRADLEG